MQVEKLPKLIKVRFLSPTTSTAGFELIFSQGTVVYTEDPNVFFVPETSLERLRQAGINFEIVPKN